MLRCIQRKHTHNCFQNLFSTLPVCICLYNEACWLTRDEALAFRLLHPSAGVMPPTSTGLYGPAVGLEHFTCLLTTALQSSPRPQFSQSQCFPSSCGVLPFPSSHCADALGCADAVTGLKIELLVFPKPLEETRRLALNQLFTFRGVGNTPAAL